MQKGFVHSLKLMAVALLLLPGLALAGGGTQIPLQKAKVNLKDKTSLQRGAKWYMNLCAGCHSLQYVRYNDMARDLHILDKKGEVATGLVQDNLIFTDASIWDMVKTALVPKDAQEWFGVEPPDLSLITRVRGVDWLYTYLVSFYQDDARPWGSNNWLFPDVGMPNVFAPWQGKQVPVYRTETIPYDGGSKEIKVIDHLQLIADGAMTGQQFTAMVHDVVNFLAYAAEPVKLTRQRLGLWVLLFLTVFLVVAYLLKKEFWRDID